MSPISLGPSGQFCFLIWSEGGCEHSEELLQAHGLSDILEDSQQVLTCPSGTGEVPLHPICRVKAAGLVLFWLWHEKPRLCDKCSQDEIVRPAHLAEGSICEHRADLGSAHGSDWSRLWLQCFHVWEAKLIS